MFVGKHIYNIFLSLFVLRNCRSAVLKLGGITPLVGDFKGQGGDKTKGGDRGETTQRGEKRSTTNQSLS